MAPFKHGDFVVRPYQPATDLASLRRIWRECGWIVQESDEVLVEDFYSVGRTLVAALDDSVECAAHTTPGTIRHQQEDLEMCGVTAVATSRIARKRGLGKIVTANAVAQSAADGTEVGTLGIFEQGYYDQLGFGNGSYEHLIAFDPADLKKRSAFRIPRRLTLDDWAPMAQAMRTRWRSHGGCILYPPEIIKAEAGWKAGGFGLGYFDDQGELSHFFFGKLENENGPLHILAMAYQDGDQLLELFALLRSLGDQVAKVTMVEPPHLHLQDLLRQPFRFRRLSKGSDHESRHRACSFWQLRMLDLNKCLSKTPLPGPSAEFNLILSDPIAEHLDDNLEWQGIAGEYRVSLGGSSSAEPGAQASLPTLRASVNAFSRLWFGIRPATSLAISDDLSGPTELLEQLDRTLRLPVAASGWYF